MTHHDLGVRSSAEERLGASWLLATGNRAALNSHIQVFVRGPVCSSWGYKIRSANAGSCGKAMLNS